jgi:hypothetical protein
MEKLGKFKTVKRFTAGYLKDVEVEEIANYSQRPWTEGTVVDHPIMGGSPYIIVSCEEMIE